MAYINQVWFRIFIEQAGCKDDSQKQMIENLLQVIIQV